MGSPAFLSLVAIGRYRAALLASGAGIRGHPKHYMICHWLTRIKRANNAPETPPGSLSKNTEQYRV
jgi:hypothetical protein